MKYMDHLQNHTLGDWDPTQDTQAAGGVRLVHLDFEKGSGSGVRTVCDLKQA